MINLARTPAILTLLKSARLDHARQDMAHSSPSVETVADMAGPPRPLDFRWSSEPPQGQREWITRLLDVGVWGPAYSPGRCTRAHAIAQAARYVPVGVRGMAGLGPDTEFDGDLSPTARLAHLNEQVHVTALLESVEAVRHPDDSMATPGIDAVALGPTNLAQELGVLDTPRQSEALDEHRRRAHRRLRLRRGRPPQRLQPAVQRLRDEATFPQTQLCAHALCIIPFSPKTRAGL